MPWEISKEAKFEAAHIIKGHKNPLTGQPGKCSRHHGHSYKIGVTIKGFELQPDLQYLIDYYWVGAALKELTERWDHHHLNGILFDPNESATLKKLLHPGTAPLVVVDDEPGFPEFQGEYNSSAERIAQVVFNHVKAFLQLNCSDAMNKCMAHVASAWCQETAGTKAVYFEA